MKKNLLLIVTIFLSTQTAFGVHFEIQTNKNTSIFQEQKSISLPQSLGAISVYFLRLAKKNKNISFVGDEKGIASIAGLENKVEEISDSEMRAYGWCYAIDGVAPDVMPNEITVQNQDSKILWFYAYSTYKDGQWRNQCIPAEGKK